MLGLENSLEDEFDQEENSGIRMVGRCRALEDFRAFQHEDTSGLIDKVDKGEELIVIQEDLGTGWTCIQTSDGSTGFLPTSILYFLWCDRILQLSVSPQSSFAFERFYLSRLLQGLSHI